MSANSIFTHHASVRAQERLNILHLEDLLSRYPSVAPITHHLSRPASSDVIASFRLLYVKDKDSFAVPVLRTIMKDGRVDHHVVATIYTTEMYEEASGLRITEDDYRLAAKAILGPVEYGEWEMRTYGTSKNLATHRLYVYFDRAQKPREVKVRNTNCSGFKQYEDPANVLAHPGAITSANNQLAKIGKTLNDRLYMRYDSKIGLIKLRAKQAMTCPYCGMEPLPTDISADK